MMEVPTKRVINVLDELGFEKKRSNSSHALYTHKAGASVSIPYNDPNISPSHLMAIERQVSGFGVASSRDFERKLRNRDDIKKGEPRIMHGVHLRTISPQVIKAHHPNLKKRRMIIKDDITGKEVHVGANTRVYLNKGVIVIDDNLTPRPVNHGRKR